MKILKQQGTTLVQRACANVKGFSTLHERLEKCCSSATPQLEGQKKGPTLSFNSKRTNLPTIDTNKQTL